MGRDRTSDLSARRGDAVAYRRSRLHRTPRSTSRLPARLLTAHCCRPVVRRIRLARKHLPQNRRVIFMTDRQ